MAYSDEAVKAKLTALNETQDSIVSNAQWIMFHRRNADRTASLWLNRLQENTNPGKRLNLIYLANEVVQQSRARSKQDFLLAFEPLIADGTATAYKGASQDIQGKLRRVVEVWRQRGIFDSRIQEQVEQRLDEIDKQKGANKTLGGGVGRLGGSLFGASAGAGGVAPELEEINKSFTALSKADSAAKAPVSSADTEYTKWAESQGEATSPAVQAARMRGLVKDLTAAHSAVGAKIKIHHQLVDALEKLLDETRQKLAEDQETSLGLTVKIDDIQARVEQVEDSIMRGQSKIDITREDAQVASSRPETEGFTPPPPDVESFTPPPAGDEDDNINDRPGQIHDQPDSQPALDGPIPDSLSAATHIQQPEDPSAAAALAAQDFLKNLMPQIRQASSSSETPPPAATSTTSPATNGDHDDPRLKRRKLSHSAAAAEDVDEEIFRASANTGVDDDSISAMLGS